jgi:hypothetical protein
MIKRLKDLLNYTKNNAYYQLIDNYTKIYYLKIISNVILSNFSLH